MPHQTPENTPSVDLAIAIFGGFLIGAIVAFLIKFAIYDSIGRAPRDFVRIHYATVTSVFVLTSMVRWWIGQTRKRQTKVSQQEAPCDITRG